MKKIILPIFALSSLLVIPTSAQNPILNSLNSATHYFYKDGVSFYRLDMGVTIGSTGIGIDFEMPYNRYIKLRTGFEFVPKFDYEMHFGVGMTDEEVDQEVLTNRFNKASDLLKSYTGFSVDDEVDMIGTPSFYDFKFLIDLYPLKNKNWHFTTGFYLGPSTIATAINKIEEAPTLFSVSMYNNLHDRIIKSYIEDEPYMTFNNMDLYANEDLYNKMNEYGTMGIHVGEYSHGENAGNSYLMTPDENCEVRAKLKVNSFKPYIGFGYGGNLLKNSDEYGISFDCGLMMWGGSPSVITHDGTDLMYDVSNIKGQVGDYVKLVEKFRVYPVINIRITKRLF